MIARPLSFLVGISCGIAVTVGLHSPVPTHPRRAVTTTIPPSSPRQIEYEQISFEAEAQSAQAPHKPSTTDTTSGNRVGAAWKDALAEQTTKRCESETKAQIETIASKIELTPAERSSLFEPLFALALRSAIEPSSANVYAEEDAIVRSVIGEARQQKFQEILEAEQSLSSGQDLGFEVARYSEELQLSPEQERRLYELRAEQTEHARAEIPFYSRLLSLTPQQREQVETVSDALAKEIANDALEERWGEIRETIGSRDYREFGDQGDVGTRRLFALMMDLRPILTEAQYRDLESFYRDRGEY